MPSTSVYLPEDLLEALDRLAASRRIPRNRIIVEALREALERRSHRWPEGYFADDLIESGDLEELRRGGRELEEAVYASRRSRSREPF